MKEKKSITFFKYLPGIIIVVISCYGLLAFSAEASKGITNGLKLLAETIIPSLFPFMILSSYIANAPFLDFLSVHFENLSQALFKVNAKGLLAVILGMLGGYPVGAKTVSELCESGRITKNEAQRLFCWCVNPSPAFAITAIGSFMLHNTTSGIIIYASVITASFLIGFLQRFFNDGNSFEAPAVQVPPRKYIFVNSVSEGSKAMLSVCSWVLVFSVISSLLNKLVINKNVATFIAALLEVTTGCNLCIKDGLPLPLLSALLGFSGFAVIFQVCPYLEKCCVNLKSFICWRIATSSLSAFICTQIIRFFPQSTSVYKVIEINSTYFSLSNNVLTMLLLIFMCVLLIFEVDNKRKIC